MASILGRLVGIRQIRSRIHTMPDPKVISTEPLENAHSKYVVFALGRN